MGRPPDRHATSIRPRKQPIQERSRATYERIVAAAARIVTEEDRSSFTMNRVGREAGVSPGTLYQYFPNRDAIVLEIFERMLDDAAEQVFGHVVASIGEPIEHVARSTVKLLLDRLDAQAPVWRVVLTEVPGHEYRRRMNAVSRRGIDLMRIHLAAQPGRTPGDDTVMTWMTVGAGEGALAQYLLGDLPGPRSAIEDALVRLIQVLTGASTPDAPA